MPTAASPITVGTTWTKVADTALAGWTASSPAVGHLEWATRDAAGAPDAALAGHILPAAQLVGRGLLGPGHAWARLVGTAMPGATVPVVVTTTAAA